MPKIKLTTPDGAKLEFELTIDRATVGRADDNDIVVPDGSVSSRHGEILLKGDCIELVDLGSTNGTHVGGERVERATVAPGGTFKLGSVEGVADFRDCRTRSRRGRNHRNPRCGKRSPAVLERRARRGRRHHRPRGHALSGPRSARASAPR